MEDEWFQNLAFERLPKLGKPSSKVGLRHDLFNSLHIAYIVIVPIVKRIHESDCNAGFIHRCKHCRDISDERF